MRKLSYTILFLVVGMLASCKVGQADLQRTQDLLDAERYTFTARSALPQRGKNINLTGEYTLLVSPDTINAYLPYFGRAYSAPFPGEEGIKFISAKFEKQTKRTKNGWEIQIITQDTRTRFTLHLNVGASGYTNLYVKEHTRDGISFYGKVE